MPALFTKLYNTMFINSRLLFISLICTLRVEMLYTHLADRIMTLKAISHATMKDGHNFLSAVVDIFYAFQKQFSNKQGVYTNNNIYN